MYSPPTRPTARGALQLCVALLPLALLNGCSGGGDDCGPFGCNDGPTPAPSPDDECVEEDATRCSDHGSFQSCSGGIWTDAETCAAPSPICDEDLGCTSCTPETTYCQGDDVYLCNSDGTNTEFVQACQATDVCFAGQCYEPCDAAAAESSYLGCEFMAVQTPNTDLFLGLNEDGAFDDEFAIVLGNPSPKSSAHVLINQSGVAVANETIEPGGSKAILLSYDMDLQVEFDSSVFPYAGISVSSDLPVMSYQFNPLDYTLDTATFSYSNDASLLLPERALGTDYLITAWPSLAIDLGSFPGQWRGGFLTVVAVEDNTIVDVTPAGIVSAGGVGPLAIGETTSQLLQRGDSLLLFSRNPESNDCEALGGREGLAASFDEVWGVCSDELHGDLSGTRVSANRPVEVFAGHSCAFVPFDSPYCDHLEEVQLPLSLWGHGAVASAPPRPSDGSPYPALYRIMSGDDGNEITLTPAPPPQDDPTRNVPGTVTLDAGEFVEFISDVDFAALGTGRVSVTQYLVGGRGLNGQDPSMSFLPPTSQWRPNYPVLVTGNYLIEGVMIAAETGAQLVLDGKDVDAAWMQIEGTDYSTGLLYLGAGSHLLRARGNERFGLVAFGYGRYTSYLLPGGLNLVR